MIDRDFYIKFFEEPVKITEYLVDDTLDKALDDFFCKVYGGYAIIKYKYNFEKDYIVSFEKIIADEETGEIMWENDWWEGQDDILVLGLIKDFCYWSDADLLKLTEFIKTLGK